MAVVCAAALTTEARAADFTWSGAAPAAEPNWSNATNWGGTAPSKSVGAITFPLLSCNTLETACTNSFNDITGLTANSLAIAGSYYLSAETNYEAGALTLGSGGLTDTGPGATSLAIPITLAASQTWQVSGKDGGGLALYEAARGAGAALHISLLEGGSLTVNNAGESRKGELAPASTLVTGTGSISLEGASIPEIAGPVELQSGTTLNAYAASIKGTLVSKGASIYLRGNAGMGYEGLDVEDLALDSASSLGFTFSQASEGEPSTTRLYAASDVSLAGAALTLAAPDRCPELTSGSEDVLIAAGGTISGQFAGIPAGGTVELNCFGPPMIFEVKYTAHAVTAKLVTTQAEPAPSVTTGSASDITGTSVTLNGTVTSESSATKCEFEYGETLIYGSKAPCSQVVPAGTTPVSVSVTGLVPGTTYHLRLVAGNKRGLGYGSDTAFTTTGISPPSVITGATYPGWPSNAEFSGFINPHGNTVTYEFYYGTVSVSVATSADLSRYQHTTGAAGTLTGTSGVTPTTEVGGLQHNTLYHVRLVALYEGHVAWGSETSFEITAPEPVAHEAPYLSTDGTDAGKGYTATCIPGSWDSVSRFAIRWVYVTGVGITGAARQGAASGASGERYHVEQSDAGHVLACVVTPYRLDGQLSYANQLQSDTLLMATSKFVVIPGWLKTVWEGVDAAGVGQDVYELALGCGPALAIPFVGELTCFADLVDLAFGNPLEDMLKEAVDPPDPHFAAVALPRASGTPSKAHYRCTRRVSSRTCRQLAALASRFAVATGRTASLLEVFAVSRNRTLIARRKHDTEAAMTQEAARKVYSGLLATAIAAQESAGIALADGLGRAKVDVRIPAATLRATMRARGSTLLSRTLRARMRADGYRTTEINRALSDGARHIRAFDLRRYLSRPSLPVPFGRYYDTLEIADVGALVGGFAQQGALPSRTVAHLLVDLDRARAACTQILRSTAMHTFLGDAEPLLRSTFYEFLSTAVQPLMDGASAVDPYPHCLS